LVDTPCQEKFPTEKFWYFGEAGNPITRLAAVEERVAATIEELAHLSTQRCHPIGIVPINGIGHVDEVSDVPSSQNFGNSDVAPQSRINHS
jgi:hypothetical protein